jgi:3-deoxy-7-phosphoheptulonate synthase
MQLVATSVKPAAWQGLRADQQPEWPDIERYQGVLAELSTLPPLVYAGECRELTEELGRVACGEAFLLQAGDCAESFDVATADAIRDRLKVVLQMAAVLTYSAGVPVVKVGRIAGQFAKPRSEGTEVRDGIELPSFRGHIVNDFPFDPVSRTPDPQRMLRAYLQSASTLNLLRAFTRGGFASMGRVHAWNQEFVASSPVGRRYDQLADGIDAALRFMTACGLDLDTDPIMRQVDLYTSHEALLLGYEQALTRQDSITGGWYDCSAHMLWIGERTRRVDGAHVAFLADVENPVGCKVGPHASPSEVLKLCEALNPARVPGRLTLITRMGARNLESALPPILEAVVGSGHPVVWACDPMHGNTFTNANGRKTRHFEDIVAEVEAFFAAHRAAGTWAGGIHVELTGENVTECLGGGDSLEDRHLEDRYETMCDPRLNGRQSLDLAFRVSEFIRVH